MGAHPLDGLAPPQLQEEPVSSGIELKQRGAELKPLGPLRPTSSDVSPVFGKHRRPSCRIPVFLNRQDLGGRQLEKSFDLRHQMLLPQLIINSQSHRALNEPAGSQPANVESAINVDDFPGAE